MAFPNVGQTLHALPLLNRIILCAVRSLLINSLQQMGPEGLKQMMASMGGMGGMGGALGGAPGMPGMGGRRGRASPLGGRLK